MKSLSLFFIFSIFAVVSAANPAVSQWPNDPFYLPADSAYVGPVDFDGASKVQSQLQNIYANEFNLRGQSDRVLQITIDWVKPYFGAFSTLLPQHNNSEDAGTNLNALNNLLVGNVTAWGGYIRVPEMTDLALAATFCHELGHHFGGAPMQQDPLPAWSSAEGQADFYAATVCLPRWLRVATEDQKPKVFHPNIIQKCKSSQPCLMVAQAGFEFVRVIHTYSYQNLPALSILVSDPAKVPATLKNVYPSYQCRLDTFLRVAESILVNKSATRPACWFKD